MRGSIYIYVLHGDIVEMDLEECWYIKTQELNDALSVCGNSVRVEYHVIVVL